MLYDAPLTSFGHRTDRKDFILAYTVECFILSSFSCLFCGIFMMGNIGCEWVSVKENEFNWTILWGIWFGH